MTTTKKMLMEYGDTEAGKALAAHGFTATRQGGAVFFRAERAGVTLDVFDSGTGMAPRENVDAVKVHINGGASADGWTLDFDRLSGFIATLK